MGLCRSVVVDDSHIVRKTVSDLSHYELDCSMQILLLVCVWPSSFVCSRRRFIGIARFLGPSFCLSVCLWVECS